MRTRTDAYLIREDAVEFMRNWDSRVKIKVCYAKPSWLKLNGLGEDVDNFIVGIFTHLVFPNWDKGDMTVREFKKICKENKGLKA